MVVAVVYYVLTYLQLQKQALFYPYQNFEVLYYTVIEMAVARAISLISRIQKNSITV